MGLLTIQRDSVWSNATGNKIIFKWVRSEDKNSKLVDAYPGQHIVKEVITTPENGQDKKTLTIRPLSTKSNEPPTNDQVEFLAVDPEMKSYLVHLCWKPMELDGSLPKGAFRVDAREYQQTNIYVGRRFGEGVGRVELKEDNWTFISSNNEEFSYGFEVLCNNWK